MILKVDSAIYKEGPRYRYIAVFKDDVSGETRTFSAYNSSDDQVYWNELDTQWMSAFQQELEYAQNPFNQDFSDDLSQQLQEVVGAIVIHVRTNPTVAYADLQTWYEANFPNNPYSFDRLYNRACVIAGTTDFETLKQYFINAKFEGID